MSFGRRQKNSTIPVLSEYSAPTTRSSFACTRCSISRAPPNNPSIEAPMFARTDLSRRPPVPSIRSAPADASTAGRMASTICRKLDDRLLRTRLGLAAVPIGAFDDARVRAVLGLQASEKPLYLIPVGRPKP